MATDHSRFASRTDKPMERRVRERERGGEKWGSYRQRAFMIAEKLGEIISPDLFIRGAPFPPLSRPLSLIVTVRNRCCFIGGCKVISRLECLVFNPVDDDVYTGVYTISWGACIRVCIDTRCNGYWYARMNVHRRWYFVGKFLLPRRILVWTGNGDYR